MATRAEMIYSVKEFLKNHTDDSLIADEHILFQIKNTRAMLLRQLYSDRAKEFDDVALQTFCVDMIVTDPGLCGIKTGCTILRSKEKIPGLLSVKGRSTLVRVGPPIIGVPGFDIGNASTIASCMEDKYATATAFIMDNYLYLASNKPATKLVKCISVTGIFSDPEDLEEFKTCESCNSKKVSYCFNEDSDLPMPAHIIPIIIDQVTKSFIQVERMAERRDTDNNSVPE